MNRLLPLILALLLTPLSSVFAQSKLSSTNRAELNASAIKLADEGLPVREMDLCVKIDIEEADLRIASINSGDGTPIENGDVVCGEEGCVSARFINLCQLQEFTCANGKKVDNSGGCKKCKSNPIVDTQPPATPWAPAGDNRDDDCQACCNDLLPGVGSRLQCGNENCK